jgi:hypothetical protein
MSLQAVRTVQFDSGMQTSAPKLSPSRRMGMKFCRFVCECSMCYWVGWILYDVGCVGPMIIASLLRLEAIGPFSCGMSRLVRPLDDFRDIWARSTLLSSTKIRPFLLVVGIISHSLQALNFKQPTGSYDATVRLWDLRFVPASLHSLVCSDESLSIAPNHVNQSKSSRKPATPSKLCTSVPQLS